MLLLLIIDFYLLLIMLIIGLISLKIYTVSKKVSFGITNTIFLKLIDKIVKFKIFFKTLKYKVKNSLIF